MRYCCVFVVAVGLLGHAAAGRADTLAHLRAAGVLSCGVLSEPADYTKDDTHGALPGLGRDICRAVAAAVLGDGQRLRVAYYPDERHGFAAVQSGQADLLVGASARLTAGPIFGIGFGRPVFYDGQSFLVEHPARIATLADLAGKHVCFIPSRQSETDLNAVLGARKVAFAPFPFEEMGEMEAALVTGHCAAMTGDVSELADARAQFHARADNFDILPEIITLDPIAPAWRQDDPQFGRIVDWTVSALLDAEQAGLDQASAAAALHGHPAEGWARLLVADRAAAQVFGIAPNWSLRAVAAIGNYAELFRRDLGDGSPLRLPRAQNRLWTDGGLMYPLSGR